MLVKGISEEKKMPGLAEREGLTRVVTSRKAMIGAEDTSTVNKGTNNLVYARSVHNVTDIGLEMIVHASSSPPPTLTSCRRDHAYIHNATFTVIGFGVIM